MTSVAESGRIPPDQYYLYIGRWAASRRNASHLPSVHCRPGRHAWVPAWLACKEGTAGDGESYRSKYLDLEMGEVIGVSTLHQG